MVHDKFTKEEQAVIDRFLKHRTTGYLIKRGQILVGPTERCIYKTEKGAEKLLLNMRGHVVKAVILEEDRKRKDS